MKKLFFLAAAVGLFTALSVDGTQTAAADELTANNQVAICHFEDHRGDFVTSGGCVRLGGNVIIVGRKACEKGHKARKLRRGGDCATADNVGLLLPGNLLGNPAAGP